MKRVSQVPPEIKDADLRAPEEAAEGVLAALIQDHNLSPRDAAIIARRALDETQSSIGASMGLSRERIGQIGRRHADLVEETRQELRMRAARAGEPHVERVVVALAETATNTESRNQAMAGRVYGEMTGIIGRGGTEIQIGDRYSDAHADVQSISFVGVSPERLRAALRPKSHSADEA